MKTLPVQIDTFLRFDESLLGDQERALLRKAMWVEDPDEPGSGFSLSRMETTGRTCISRGFAVKLRKGMERFGWQIEWDDLRVKVPADYSDTPMTMTPFPYQEKAILRLIAAQQGIWEAPTAAGKTIGCGMMIKRIQQTACIIVNTIDLASQWQTRLLDVGLPSSIIGDGDWDDTGDIVIVTRQSLWARRHALDEQKWWRRWGAVIVDECHGLSGETMREILQRFPSFYRFGVSATPDRYPWLKHATKCIVGELVCRTTEQELEDAGRLVKPEVFAIKTDFQPFRWQFQKSGQTQWTKLAAKLVDDPGRMSIIGDVVESFLGHIAVVQTDRTTHATEIMAMALARGWEFDNVVELTSKQGREERVAIRERGEEGGSLLVVSTIAKEGFDMPAMDRYLLAWPTKSEISARQTLGRLKRVHATKTDAPRYYYLYDHLMPPCVKQFAAQRMVYEQQGLKLTIGTVRECLGSWYS